VGAGPVGLFAALRLAQAGIPVTCIEAMRDITSSPRAMTYLAAAVREFDRAGILQDIKERGGMEVRRVSWRKMTNHEIIARVEDSPEERKDPHENLVLDQRELMEIMLDHLSRYSCANVEFGLKVVDVDQSSGTRAKVALIDSKGEYSIRSASYVIAADGCRSRVRRMLGIDFNGFTYDGQVVYTDVVFPFDDYGFEDINFLVDPVHWAVISKIDNKGLWRVAYVEEDGLSEGELIARLPWKFAMFFPGPTPPEYKLVCFLPYRLDQRCASEYRSDRVLLAGDAAHVCAALTGINVSAGLIDAAAAADALIALKEEVASERILSSYAEARRHIFLETVNLTTQDNIERMQDADPETLGQRDPLLRTLQRTSRMNPADISKLAGHVESPMYMEAFHDISERSGM
jgi:2-polyprenyl-6-methoxyphenol hydroxylase-like FAD-dependent oxidoreductase